MNLTEKLAATYLRLNGFLLLPHFTVFDGDRHGHIDLLGLRAADSSEGVGDHTFPIDPHLFNAIGEGSERKLIAVAAEVRSRGPEPDEWPERWSYARRFFGGIAPQRMLFTKSSKAVVTRENLIVIGLYYAGVWIQSRIDEMESGRVRLTKSGSWTLSDSFLSDFLELRSHKLLTDERPK